MMKAVEDSHLFIHGQPLKIHPFHKKLPTNDSDLVPPSAPCKLCSKEKRPIVQLAQNTFQNINSSEACLEKSKEFHCDTSLTSKKVCPHLNKNVNSLSIMNTGIEDSFTSSTEECSSEQLINCNKNDHNIRSSVEVNTSHSEASTSKEYNSKVVPNTKSQSLFSQSALSSEQEMHTDGTTCPISSDETSQRCSINVNDFRKLDSTNPRDSNFVETADESVLINAQCGYHVGTLTWDVGTSLSALKKYSNVQRNLLKPSLNSNNSMKSCIESNQTHVEGQKILQSTNISLVSLNQNGGSTRGNGTDLQLVPDNLDEHSKRNPDNRHTSFLHDSVGAEEFQSNEFARIVKPYMVHSHNLIEGSLIKPTNDESSQDNIEVPNCCSDSNQDCLNLCPTNSYEQSEMNSAKNSGDCIPSEYDPDFDYLNNEPYSHSARKTNSRKTYPGNNSFQRYSPYSKEHQRNHYRQSRRSHTRTPKNHHYQSFQLPRNARCMSINDWKPNNRYCLRSSRNI